MYRDTSDNAHEYHLGKESPANEKLARQFAWTRISENATNVVIRCTYPGDTPNITHTAWAEVITSSEAMPDYVKPTNALRECLDDLMHYTIPQLLTELDRAELRRETLTPQWFIDSLRTIEAEIGEVL